MVVSTRHTEAACTPCGISQFSLPVNETIAMTALAAIRDHCAIWLKARVVIDLKLTYWLRETRGDRVA